MAIKTKDWTWDQLVEALGISYQGEPFEIKGFTLDSRLVEEGDVYVAIKGGKTDGHAYVGDAFSKGASAAIVEQEMAGVGPLLRVENVREALKKIARFQRARLGNARILAITGSVGKTSTKEMLRLALSAYGKSYATYKSYNTIYGLPLTLAGCPLEVDYVVLELGMNHAGEIRELVELAAPEIAIVTGVSMTHAGFFEGLGDIARAKAEIFERLPSQGVALLRSDPETEAILMDVIPRGVRMITFGAPQDSTFLMRYEATSQGARIEAMHQGRIYNFEVGVPGRHMAQNTITVLATLGALGLDPQPGLMALKEFRPVPGRGMIQHIPWKGGTLTLLDESYNAGPKAMEAALVQMGELPTSGRRVALLGQMGELGVHSENLHRALKDTILKAKIDACFLCGEGMRYLKEELPPKICKLYELSNRDLWPAVKNYLQPGDLVMVKGSLLTTDMPWMVRALKGEIDAL